MIVPVYNCEEYLPECLASLDLQTCEDFEVILVDDGSTDASGLICDEYMSLHVESCVVIHKINEGLLMARRDGLSKAKDGYIMFLDGDDILHPSTIELIKKKIEISDSDIVCFDYCREASFTKGKLRNRIITPGLYGENDMLIVQEAICGGEMNNLCNKAIKKSLFDTDRDYYSLRGLMHGEDLLQLLPVINNASSFLYIDNILYYYRKTDSSSTGSFKPSQINDLKIVFSQVNIYANKWGHGCVKCCKIMIWMHIYYLISGLVSCQKDFGFKKKNMHLIQELFMESLDRPLPKFYDCRLDAAISVHALIKGWYGLSLMVASCANFIAHCLERFRLR